MKPVLILFSLSLATVSPSLAGSPAFLFAPLNPQHATHLPRYAPVTSGIKRFEVVGPKDWRQMNQAVGPQVSGAQKRDTGIR